ncbi:MAG TPA: hypothetical protein VMZ03_02560 [Chitinophagaceae bacterium]|nr:hypothetical protein [Chitinophagaceae bacterium]
MLLTIAPFGEFTKLFQVLLLIILPLLAFSMLATVLLHYGKKRKKERVMCEESLHTYIAGSLPENFCYKTSNGEFIYLDHTGLLKEYRNKLSYSHARYAALQQDFKRLESGFSGPPYINRIYSDHPQKISMEHPAIHTTHMNISETLPPHNEIKENEYLHDLVDEKKKQIEFLQNQIDLRIKSYHYAEKEKEEMRLKWESSEEKRNNAEQELANLQASMEERSHRVAEVEQILQAKQEQVVYMENVLQEVKAQNEVLCAGASDAEDKNRRLEQKLEIEEAKVGAMEQKLIANKHLLRRLYNEFSVCLQDETAEPQVIALRPDYITHEWPEKSALTEETAVQ